MNKRHQFGEGFDKLPDSSHIVAIQVENPATHSKFLIENLPGKEASVRIYAGIAVKNIITAAEARKGLDLYGDYVQEELNFPNSHPNVRLLLDIIAENQQLLLTIR